MPRKKNKRKTDEYLINTIEYSTWENEITLSRTYGDVVSTYIQSKCLPAVETTSSQHVASDVTFMRNEDSPDDIEVDVVDVQPTSTTTEELLSTDVHYTATQVSLTSTEIENCATPPVSVNICGVENGFQLNSGASMSGSNTVVSPSVSATKPTVNKLFNPSISTKYLHRLNPLVSLQETSISKEKTKYSSEQNNSRKQTHCEEKSKELPTEDKLHACNVCDYKSPKKSYLKQHMITHTGKKPFACDVCDYKCSRKGDLKRHMRTHAGEKPHVCDVCGYKCSQKGNLTCQRLRTDVVLFF